jgi:hypothetical protein
MGRLQDNWRWCQKCQALFFAGNVTSVCPAGGGHENVGSADYRLLVDSEPEFAGTSDGDVVVTSYAYGLDPVDGSAGIGVYGQGNTGATGVHGYSDTGVGLVGYSEAFDAVQGLSNSPQHAAVSAVNEAGGFGVWARATQAGHFEGDVRITGALTVDGDTTLAQRGWVAPYFNLDYWAGDERNPPAWLATTVVQVLNVSRDNPVQAMVLFWNEGHRLDAFTAEWTIPPYSMRDHKPSFSPLPPPGAGETQQAGWVMVSGAGPVVPGGWVDQTIEGQWHRTPLAFQPFNVDMV